MEGFVGNEPPIKFALSPQEHFLSAPGQQGIRVCKPCRLLRDAELRCSTVSPTPTLCSTPAGAWFLLGEGRPRGSAPPSVLPGAGCRPLGPEKAPSTQRGPTRSGSAGGLGRPREEHRNLWKDGATGSVTPQGSNRGKIQFK